MHTGCLAFSSQRRHPEPGAGYPADQIRDPDSYLKYQLQDDCAAVNRFL